MIAAGVAPVETMAWMGHATSHDSQFARAVGSLWHGIIEPKSSRPFVLRDDCHALESR